MDSKRLLLLGTDPYAGYRRTAAMTLSGNEITDSVRAAGVEGDGLTAPDNSVGIWGAATNLCTNGGFETNTTGWAVGGANTIARSADVAKFGSYSAKATYQDNAMLASFGVTLTAAIHSASCWLYVPTAFDGTSVTVGFVGFVGATGTLTANADLAIRDRWQRVTVKTVTIVAGDLAGSIDVTCGGAPTASRYVYIDGFQIETGSIATPYVETNGGTASRTSARVQVPVTNLGLTPTQGWVAVRTRVTHASTETCPTNSPFVVFGSDANNYLVLYRENSTAALRIARIGGGAGHSANLFSAAAWAAGATLTIIGKWSSTGLTGSLNGAAFPTEAAQTTIPSVGATLDISSSGAVFGAQQTAPGDVLWFACGPGTLTNGQAAAIHAMGNRPDYHALRAMGATGIWDCREPAVLRY